RRSVLEFFPNDSADDGLKRFLLLSHKRAQGFVDQCLVVAAAGIVDLGSEPIEDIVINANGNAGLYGSGLDDGAALTLGEVILFADDQLSLSWVADSDREAWRAEMMRELSRRWVQETTRTRPRKSRPRVT